MQGFPRGQVAHHDRLHINEALFRCKRAQFLELFRRRYNGLFAQHMLSARQHPFALRVVKGIRAGDIHRVYGRALRQRVRGRIDDGDFPFARESLPCFQAAGVDGGDINAAGQARALDKVPGDGAGADDADSHGNKTLLSE